MGKRHGLAIEGDFAVRLVVDVARAEWLSENHLRAIQSFFPVIELHNFVVRGGTQTAQELIANNAIHAGVLLPAREFPYRTPDDLLNRSITVLRNGSVLGEADSRALHDELGSRLALLATHLEQAGTLLRKGQIVLTGSPLPLYPVSPGDAVEVRCPGLQAVTAAIAPF